MDKIISNYKITIIVRVNQIVIKNDRVIREKN